MVISHVVAMKTHFVRLSNGSYLEVYERSWFRQHPPWSLGNVYSISDGDNYRYIRPKIIDFFSILR